MCDHTLGTRWFPLREAAGFPELLPGFPPLGWSEAGPPTCRRPFLAAFNTALGSGVIQSLVSFSILSISAQFGH